MQPSTPEAGPLTRVRLDVSYDGGEFSGWAVQPSRRTVQGELETALATILRVPSVALTVAGRTDAGVHASGQVAHCDLPATLLDDMFGAGSGGWTSGLLRRVNRVLAPDVRVRAVREVPAEFDARFGALWRRYEYRLCDAPTGVEPLLRRHVVAWPRALDVPAMDAAAAHLVGLHDFAAFCRRREGATTVRAVQRFAVSRVGHDVLVGIRADAFCHSMVRSLVGALLAVGEGRKEPGWPASLLASTERANGVSVAPAHGLSLVEVAYPPDAELAARSLLTRARRD